MATVRGIRDGASGYGFTAFAEKGIKAVTVGTTFIYRELLKKIVEFFKTGKSPVEPATMIEIMAFIEAANKSGANHGAGEIAADMTRVLLSLVAITPRHDTVSCRGLAALARAAGRRHLERARSSPTKWPDGRAEGRLAEARRRRATPASPSRTAASTRSTSKRRSLQAEGRRTTASPTAVERVLCFDAATGKPLWSHKYPVKYGDARRVRQRPAHEPDHPRRQGLHARRGRPPVLLRREDRRGHLAARHGRRVQGARCPSGASPARRSIDGDRVIVHLGAKDGGCVIAFDRHTGKEKWRSLDDPAGYCTPAVFDTPAGRVLVLWTPKNIHGARPRDRQAALEGAVQGDLRRLDRQPDLPRRDRLRHRLLGRLEGDQARRRSRPTTK